MRPDAVLETALYASDLDAAEGFYGGVLGLPRVARVGERHVFFRLGGAMLLVFNPAATERPPRRPGAAGAGAWGARAGACRLRGDGGELDGWRERLEAAGVAIEADFLWPNGARSIYVRDPAGNSVDWPEPRLWGFES